MPKPLALTIADLKVEPLTDADFDNGPAPLAVQRSPIAKLRERHHAVARHLSEGHPINTVSVLTGYTPQRITDLQADPAFQDLVSHYRSQQEDASADYVERMRALGVDAVNEIHDRLEEEPEKISIDQLLGIAKSMADRTGHGPSTTTNQNVNIGIAEQLRAADQRLRRAKEAEIVDVTPEASE